MADLIDRAALMRNFCGYDLNECTKYGNKTVEQQNNSYSTMMMYEIADKIEDAPAVDAVEVPTDNVDNLELAVKALGIFRLSFCLNVKETEKANDIVFRCSDCPFENHRTRKCSIKIFFNEFATHEQRERFSPIL